MLLFWKKVVKEERGLVMLQNKMLSFSILCLAGSLVISSLIMANCIKSNGEYVSRSLDNISGSINYTADNIGNMGSNLHQLNETIGNISNSNTTERSTFGLWSAASYLGIKHEELMKIINTPDSGIPYIKKENDIYIFHKGALDKWLETARIELE